MYLKIINKPKIVLLRSSIRYGFLAFAKQIYLIILDTVIRKRHLVFHLSSEQIPKTWLLKDADLSFREISSWSELNGNDYRKIFDQNNAIDIGGEGWFDRGWRLWVGELNESLAALGWWRGTEQSQNFFCTVPENSEVLWHVTVLPEFQGKNLHILLWITLMQARIQNGVENFYTNCRDHNIPSHRNILKMGFRCIGYCTVSKWTKRRKWHPVCDEETHT